MSRLGKGANPRRDAKESFRDFGSSKGNHGRRLGIQIMFITTVVLCTCVSYYAMSLRLLRSSAVPQPSREAPPTDRFSDLLIGVNKPYDSVRGAFTLPWDDWPPQQVHSLFFAHKELPRTEEFDREELGILRELEKREKDEIEHAGTRRGRESKGEGEDGADSVPNSDTEVRNEGGGSQSKSNISAQETSLRLATEVEGGIGFLEERVDDSGKVGRKSGQSAGGVGLRGAKIEVEEKDKGEQMGVDDGRGWKERQLRIQRGRFETPPGLYDAISDEGYHQCVDHGPDWAAPPTKESRGYMFPALDGGLSQQIFEIANAVVIARILNVTLVVPEMRADAFWKDGSDFATIFDLQNFKSVLSGDIRVVTMKELPAPMQQDENWIYVDRVQDGLPGDYVTALGDSFRPGHVTFLYSMWAALSHVIDPPLEKLRCRAKYQALRFSPTVINISDALQRRMRERARGPFLAVHLRFEVDMVMHQAGCDYGINDPEEEAFWTEERKRRGWPEPRPDEHMRMNGYCPPTPEEIGKWLQGLGFNRSTQVYLASGKAYHEDVFLPPFFDMFPSTFKKEDLLTEDEKRQVSGKNNLLAAIDFGVLAEADVVALTFHGVMKLSIQGHRMWNGFHKTLLYPNWESWNFRNLDWKEYRKRVAETTPIGRPSLRTEEAVVEVMGNPIPECMCRTPNIDSIVQ